MVIMRAMKKKRVSPPRGHGIRQKMVSKKILKTMKTIESSHSLRNDTELRGIHKDAIQAGIAPSRASACVSCNNKIDKHAARWGLKYAGNPLSIPVLPLYGAHPMVQWCHAGGCGLAYIRYNDMASLSPAARTCHACQDAPERCDENKSEIRLLCGGPQRGQKIRHHVFHIRCWIRSIQEGCDASLHSQLIVKPEEIVHTRRVKKLGGLSWDDLTLDEREFVNADFHKMACL